MSALRAVPGACLLALAALAPLRAQSAPDWNPAGLELSREELEQLLERLERAAASGAYTRELRERATEEAELVRLRLEEGDFHAGDQLALFVEGEEELQATFVVTPDQTVVLPQIGPVSLRGVLRGEAESHLRQELSRYIREPVVRTKSLLRLSVLGQVGKPGFFVVPSTALLSDLLMMVGGPAPTADLDRITIERAERIIWDGAAVQDALHDGRTLDQLSLQAGDGIVVPAQRQSTTSWLRTAVYVVPSLVTLLVFLR